MSFQYILQHVTSVSIGANLGAGLISLKTVELSSLYMNYYLNLHLYVCFSHFLVVLWSKFSIQVCLYSNLEQYKTRIHYLFQTPKCSVFIFPIYIISKLKCAHNIIILNKFKRWMSWNISLGSHLVFKLKLTDTPPRSAPVASRLWLGIFPLFIRRQWSEAHGSPHWPPGG